MTDRHSGYIVILGADQREDDAEAVINAIRMVKGVLSVEPVVAGIDMAEVIALARVKRMIWDLLAGLKP